VSREGTEIRLIAPGTLRTWSGSCRRRERNAAARPPHPWTPSHGPLRAPGSPGRASRF